jgi:hypothetical protein
MSIARFASKIEATKAHWFSRRHETGGPNSDAREKYKAEQQAKRDRATGPRV